MIERAMKMGSVPQCTTPSFGPCLLISQPKFVWIDFFFWGFGFRLFVRLECSKLFDGLPVTLDMESTIVIKV
ncbi:hypothetical protein RHSIM_Rhsim09G0135800 [Rhododendron simsii]|uniref:Uncharacterized protein n=1 Tax=Rhododendron simsii TaxID=118357 RepID=A0A834GCF1_RHOSS|nr:hypothetical protein RHSIM_Rhsim09G0135800 [Rhododendron simsii]